MKAVNLLPERHRPRRPTGAQQGSSYIVLGGLAALLLAVVFYVLTLNSINGQRSDIAATKAEAAKAEAEAKRLGAYGDFSKVKEARVAAVKELAGGRFDWERLVLELAHVLPEDVWLLSADGAASGLADAAAPGAAGAAPGAQAAGSGEPEVKLVGCARSQSQVAVALVRLRELQGANDVKLNESGKGEEQTAAAPAATQSSEGCGSTNGRANYQFEAVVTFDRQAAKGDAQAPPSLGGGA